MCWVLRRYQTGLYHWRDSDIHRICRPGFGQGIGGFALGVLYAFDVVYPNGMLGVMSFIKEICLEFVLQNTP